MLKKQLPKATMRMTSLPTLVVLSSVAINLPVGLGMLMQYLDRRRKRNLLEAYLRAESLNATNGRNGLHTLVHLVVKLGLTEDEILEASFRSRCIVRMAPVDRDPKERSDVLLGYQHPVGNCLVRQGHQAHCG